MWVGGQRDERDGPSRGACTHTAIHTHTHLRSVAHAVANTHRWLQHTPKRVRTNVCPRTPAIHPHQVDCTQAQKLIHKSANGLHRMHRRDRMSVWRRPLTFCQHGGGRRMTDGVEQIEGESTQVRCRNVICFFRIQLKIVDDR